MYVHTYINYVRAGVREVPADGNGGKPKEGTELFLPQLGVKITAWLVRGLHRVWDHVR